MGKEEERKNIDRTASGEWSSTVTDADLIAAVEEHSPAATSEVGDEVGMTRAGAHQRLHKLLDTGEIEKKKIAASLVWFLADGASDENETDTDEGSAMPTVEDGLNPDAVTEDVIPDE